MINVLLTNEDQVISRARRHHMHEACAQKGGYQGAHFLQLCLVQGLEQVQPWEQPLAQLQPWELVLALVWQQVLVWL